MFIRYVFFFLAMVSPAAGQAEFPAKVSAGEVFELNWKNEPAGRLAVLRMDAEGKYLRSGDFIYLNSKKTSYQVPAPVEPGGYFIGKQDGDDWVELKALEVADVKAGLEVPEAVEINQVFEVKWSGPNGSNVTIGIYQPGTDEQKEKRFDFGYPANAKGKPLTLTSPLEPGAYEVRYMMRDRQLASQSLHVGGTSANLAADATVPAGSELEIKWSGPVDSQNSIGFVKAGGAERSGHYRYVPNIEGDTLILTAPEELGDYEVAFMVRSRIIARHPVKVVPATATLRAPGEVTEFQKFEVQWSGPGNRGDSIAAIDAEGARVSVVYPMPESTVKEGTAEMRAPAAGSHTLQYLTNRKKVLAERPITILPAPQKPGTLVVNTETARSFGANSAVEVILDASGSMLQRQGGKQRIEVARETLLGLLGGAIAEGTPFALRVFGHKEANSCRTDLEIPLGPLDVAAAKSKVSAIQSKNLAKTPIAASLLKTREDLKGVTGERVIILLTDGEETCGGDPLASIGLLKEEGADVRVSVVAYAIDDAQLRETFQIWAAVGNGQYLDAPDAAQLAAAMKQALQLPFEVLDDGDVIESGITGGNPLVLAAGDYELRYRWDGKEVRKAVRIEPEAATEVRVP